ncbi:MAG TPA: hypothetical protein VE570_13370 [Thermoleophilaceae bacterium]|jgi:hypothetical protein|nr:hypothetical protein [Thermoleophilaceae bacterium]
MRRVVCLTVLALACSGPAVQARHDAAKPPDIGYAGQSEQGLPGFVKLLPGGKITAALAYSTFCRAGNGSIVWSGVARTSLRGGRFHYERKEDSKGPAITLDGRLTKTGASGTWHVHYSLRNNVGTVTDTCDSETVNWSFPRDGAGGQSSQGFPVALRLGGKSVKTMQFVTRVKCRSGDEYVIPTFYDNFPLSSNGSFSRTFSDDGLPSGGRNTKLNIEVRGRKGRGVVHGSWHMSAVFSDKAGKQLDTCDSGPLTWSVIP